VDFTLLIRLRSVFKLGIENQPNVR
jgi:hypothetical protein